MMIILILPGSDIGKAKGSLRSDPEAGQDLECPCKVGRGRTMSSSPDPSSPQSCPPSQIISSQPPRVQVSSWQCWDPATRGWTPDPSVAIFKYKLYRTA